MTFTFHFCIFLYFQGGGVSWALFFSFSSSSRICPLNCVPFSFSFCQLRVPSSTNPEQNVNFRSLLLTTCQKEFEKDSENEQKILDKKALLKKAESVSTFKFHIFTRDEFFFLISQNRRYLMGNFSNVGAKLDCIQRLYPGICMAAKCAWCRAHLKTCLHVG